LTTTIEDYAAHQPQAAIEQFQIGKGEGESETILFVPVMTICFTAAMQSGHAHQVLEDKVNL